MLLLVCMLILSVRLADAQPSPSQAQTQHLNHQPQTAWNTLPINEL